MIGKTGTAGGTGYVIEYCGEAIRDLSMEGRMTVCNMAIEGGARAGLIAPDEKTYEYCMGRPHAPKGAQWEAALALVENAVLRRRRALGQGDHHRRRGHRPRCHLGHLARGRAADHRERPAADDFKGGKVEAAQRSLDYMGLTPGTPLTELPSTRCSSGLAPTAGSKICAQLAQS